MTLAITEEDIQFQREVRDFIGTSFPDDLRAKADVGEEFSRDDTVRWMKILSQKGWLASGWPEAFGGTGWPVHWQYIFEDEMALAGCPAPIAFNMKMIGPILMAHGTKAQQERFLPGILNADDWWCQGYSEPGSGSDLASLRTRAVRDGDEYVINGSKIWTSLAQHANKMFCLVRTDPDAKPQEGISFLLIDDFKAPGIEVRPLHLINGRHHFNEVFFEDVRVPVENRVGDEHAGWTVAKSLLAHERLNGARATETKRCLERLRAIAAEEAADGATLLDQDWFRRKLWRLEVDLAALQQTIVRFMNSMRSGLELGPETSMLRARGAIVQQQVRDLMVDAVAHYGLPMEADVLDAQEDDDFWGPVYARTLAAQRYQSRGMTIASGTYEVQAMVTAKRVLEL
ncbi:MAG: acyl-CoA dehydrogenase family protein [Pseudomonadota bacterium]